VTDIARACIIGHPVKHSRSPMIHGYWLRTLGIPGAYDRQDVRPEDLPAFLAAMPADGYRGGNVTVPHKEAAYRLVGVATDRAHVLEAVNTLWFEDGRLHGDNTDVLGFVASLDEGAPDWAQATRTALVLGAGGAARAVIAGLLDRGVARVLIANRSMERAASLAARFGPRVTAIAWDGIAAALPGIDLLVQTTSLGMQGQPPLVLSLDGLPATAVVTDIVYVPLETDLLKAAKARGNRTVDGLGMLLHQAAAAFSRWFGAHPSVTPELRALVEADIRGETG
jgi:shikimate dehydrogenase